MDFGSALLVFGLDIELLQGIVNHLYENDRSLQSIEGENGRLRLELDAPAVETRQDSFRIGVHLTGRLFIGQESDPRVFDAWVRLKPEVVTGADGFPAGTLRFDEVEDCVPAILRPVVTSVFQPDGFIGKVLASLSIPVFADLLASANEQLFSDVELDMAAFSTSFYLGRSTPIRRPLYAVTRVDDHYEPELDLDITYATVPALMAAVGLAGSDPTPPGAPSIVRPGTGLGLVTTASLFRARFDRESESIKGTTLEGLTMDRLNVVSTDYGFDVDGEGHKTGAEVDFAGALMVQYRGGVGGEIKMRSTVETDVDTAFWVDVLSVVAAIVPGLGWFLGDIFIWSPVQEAPGKVEAALLDKFSIPLATAAQQVANSFGIENIPTSALLADVWFFDGNMSVAAAAFAGIRTAEVTSVSRDVAYVAAAPGGAGKHSNRRRPVVSVADITLSSGHTLKPWQAGQFVKDSLLRIPGHHAVSNALVRNGVYLRSNPDDTGSNNLLA
jgi:hypothetical protein